MQVFHVAYAAEQDLDSRSASTTGMAQLLLLSALLAEFRDCSSSVLGMLGRLHHLDLHQHLESVPFHESIQLEAG